MTWSVRVEATEWTRTVGPFFAEAEARAEADAFSRGHPAARVVVCFGGVPVPEKRGS